MLAVLEDPAIRARAHAISVASYHQLVESGIVVNNVELLRGALFEKMSQSPLHASIVELLRDYLLLTIPPDLLVRQEKPITLLDSEPEPDIAIVRGSRSDFLTSHPASADLIIEVAVTSEALDRLKLQLYAEAGVRECWLILAEQRVVERHTDPEGSAYRKVDHVTFPATLESTIFPELSLPSAGLFPG